VKQLVYAFFYRMIASVSNDKKWEHFGELFMLINMRSSGFSRQHLSTMPVLVANQAGCTLLEIVKDTR